MRLGSQASGPGSATVPLRDLRPVMATCGLSFPQMENGLRPTQGREEGQEGMINRGQWDLGQGKPSNSRALVLGSGRGCGERWT